MMDNDAVEVYEEGFRKRPFKVARVDKVFKGICAMNLAELKEKASVSLGWFHCNYLDLSFRIDMRDL